jgi:hypothetical protein
MSTHKNPLPGKAPLCECGCGLPVKSRKNGVWSRWRPGHAQRGSDWQARTPEKPRHREARQRDIQLSLFEYDSLAPAGALSREELQLVLWDGRP